MILCFVNTFSPGDMYNMCVYAKSLQLCLTLCNPMDCSLPGSSVRGSFQNTGVDCHFLLQGFFLIQGLNPSPALQGDSLPTEPLHL